MHVSKHGAFLGETPVDVKEHPVYGKYTSNDWAMLWITRWGPCDGGHHKAWVLDQVARILKGIEIKVTVARWEDGLEEYRFKLSDQLSPEYVAWRARIEAEYGYDEGVPP